MWFLLWKEYVILLTIEYSSKTIWRSTVQLLFKNGTMPTTFHWSNTLPVLLIWTQLSMCGLNLNGDFINSTPIWYTNQVAPRRLCSGFARFSWRCGSLFHLSFSRSYRSLCRLGFRLLLIRRDDIQAISNFLYHQPFIVPIFFSTAIVPEWSSNCNCSGDRGIVQ